MASSYTGNPVAVQAPSPAPGPGVAPVVSIPSDTTDDMNTASIAQMVKTPADFLAYYAKLLNAQIPLTSSDLPQVLLKDSAGNNRRGFDHLGYGLSADIIEIQEDWFGAASALTATTSPMTGFSRWNLSIASTGNSVSTLGGSSIHPYPNLQLSLGNTNTSAIGLTLLGSSWFQAVNSMVFVADIVSPVSWGGIWTMQVGLNAGGASPNQAVFSASNAAANWQCITRDNAAAATTVDSGVAFSTITGSQRLRVELHGASSQYGAVARFFINGATTPVASIATTQPAVNHTVTPGFNLLSGDTTASRQISIGPVRFLLNRVLSAAQI